MNFIVILEGEKITIYSIINNLVLILFLFFVINFSWEKVLYKHFLNENFLNQLVIHANNTFVSDASFPNYFLPENVFQLFYLLPIKIIYFLFRLFHGILVNQYIYLDS